MTEPIRLGLQSSDLEDVYDAIIDIGKHGHTDLADLVAPYLSSPFGFLREAALRTLTFHLGMLEHRDAAVEALDHDADPDVREAAAMGLGRFARWDRDALARLLRLAVEHGEQEPVRAAAFLAALVAAGIDPTEFPQYAVVPGFAERADWTLLARALGRAGMTLPPGVTAKLPAARLTVDRLHAMCEQVCLLPSAEAAEVVVALGMPGPIADEGAGVVARLLSPPIFARRVAVASSPDGWDSLTIEPAGVGPSLAELDRRFGPGGRVPIAHESSAYVYAYEVMVPRAPWTCALFAAFEGLMFRPQGGSLSTELTLRRDAA